MAPAHLFRQAHQAAEHGRHHVHPFRPARVDRPQQDFGVEFRHQEEVAVEAQAAGGIDEGRAVIHRAGHHRAHAVPQAEGLGDHGAALFQGVPVGDGPGHALGLRGGAGGVHHGEPARRGFVGGRLEAAAPGLPAIQIVRPARRIVGNAVGRDQAGRRLDDENPDAVRHEGPDFRQQIGVDDQDGGAAVRQDRAHLRAAQMPVDRRDMGADPVRREHGFQERDVVAQQHGDRAARPEAERPEPRRRAARVAVERRLVQRAVRRRDGAVRGNEAHGGGCGVGCVPQYGPLDTAPRAYSG